MDNITYEKLHTEINKILPKAFVEGTFIQEHLSKNFDHRLINYDPYKEILPTYYSWHKKVEPDSDCIIKGGAIHTARLLHYIPKNKEQSLLADVIIAVCAHEVLRSTEHMADADREAWMSLEASAKQAVKAADYPLWHHSRRSYLPEVPEGFTCMELSGDVSGIAKRMAELFTKAFEPYTVIYHGYTENCYAKAEEYKISQSVNW